MPVEHEPERYELFEAPPYRFTLDRREFLGAAGVLLTLTDPSEAAAQSSASSPASRIHIADNGIVTVFTGKVEVGQGSRTQIAMAAAEELRIPLERIRVVMADTSLVPNDGITAGSRTTPSTIPAVRKAAAAARPLLPPAALATPRGSVLGAPQRRVDGLAIVTGRHQYPSDIVRPNMLYGAVLRAPAYHSTLQSADLDAAKSVPGAIAVRDGAFIGVAAKTSFDARKALAAIAATAKWDRAAHPSSKGLYEHLRSTVSTSRPPRENVKGRPLEILAASPNRVRATYHVPYIQHAPMEPRAAAAEWNEGALTVWTGTQNPFGVRDQLAQAFRLPAEKIRVIVPDSGGGFGGKHTGETAIEAARLAREARRPVSLRWTRAEEFRWAYFRPAGLFDIEAALDGAGKIAAWDYANYNAGTAGLESPYDAPHSRTRFLYCDSPLREGSYRGIAATANNFARECFIDELAAAAGSDPLTFRLANLSNPRLRGVLERAAEAFHWKSRAARPTPGRGIGLACGVEKGSYVAACAEVSVHAGRPVIHQFTMAYECGAIQNPLNLRAQVEGSVIQGLGAALMEEIVFENGALLNGSFAQYRVPRFRDVPPLKIVLVNREDLPSAGAGETPIIAVAPAIANAFHAATGQRARSLPIRA